MYRRGVHVTRGGKGKHHWIVLPTKYQAGTDQSQLGYKTREGIRLITPARVIFCAGISDRLAT